MVRNFNLTFHQIKNMSLAQRRAQYKDMVKATGMDMQTFTGLAERYLATIESIRDAERSIALTFAASTIGYWGAMGGFRKADQVVREYEKARQDRLQEMDEQDEAEYIARIEHDNAAFEGDY